MATRLVDLHHLGEPNRIGCWIVDGVLVDPGPQSTLPALYGALGDDRPEAVLLTHIHFDHAGGVGTLLRRWPDLPVFVHRSGAPHLVDPSRLVRSATRVWGLPGMARFWGDVVPVPEANLRPLDGGERVLDAFVVAYTPGHAAHHVSFLHEPSKVAFVGDVAGIRVVPATPVLAPAPPPDIDVPQWLSSLDTVQRWEPRALALTHFGLVHDVAVHLERMRSALLEEAAHAELLDASGFDAWMREWLRGRADEAVADLYLSISPPEVTWHGLARWLGRQ